MNFFKKPFLIFFLVFQVLFIQNALAIFSGSNATDDLFLKKISIESGLSQATVNCFLEDRLGFLWVGTDDGLNRFDGVEVINYRIRDGLSNSTILDLKLDASGNIWIGTASGLNKYDIKLEAFTQYTNNTINNYYSRILIDSAGQKIWLAANAGGIKYLDLTSGEIHQYQGAVYDEFLVWDLARLNSEEILVGSRDRGIFKMNIESMDLTHFLNDTTSVFPLPTNNTRKILVDGDLLYIGLEGGGFCVFNAETKTHKIFNQANSKLSTNQIYNMALDGHNLLIGTDGGGLNVFNTNDYSIVNYQFDETDKRSISSNVIRSIFADHEGGLWVGTYNEGINYVNQYSKNIFFHGKKIIDKNSLTNKNITSFQEDNSGKLWIGTDGGGLNLLEDGKFSAFRKGTSRQSLSDDVIMCLSMDKEEALLIGTFRGGLNVYKNGEVSKYLHNENDSTSISNNWIWDIVVDEDGNYWIGTNEGLNMFDPKTKIFTRFKPIGDFTYLNSRNSVRSLLIDNEGSLWLGSFGGLGKFNIKERTFEYFIIRNGQSDGLSNDVVVKIFEDSKKQIWIGTYGGGLCRFNKSLNTFKTYNEDDGLPSNLVQSIEEDDHGNLWLSTIKGLVKFNPSNESFQVLDVSFGLQGEVFKHNSSYKNSDGYLFFGGINGFNYFQPDSIQFPQITKSVVFTDFQIYNSTVKPDEQGAILHQSVTFTDNISMSYENSRFFSIHFSLPNFTTPEKLKYSYLLEGFDNQWNYIGSDRKVSFTGLNPGSYILKVKVSDSNIWPEEYSEISLRIVPPFYMRYEFIAVCFVTLTIIVFGSFTYRSINYRKRQIELEKLVESKNKEIKTQNKELKVQNIKLTSTQKQLQGANNTLEEKVKKRTETLKRTVDKLNKSVVELDRFVYSASHDLSAPLKSIQGLVNIARIENKDGSLEIHLDYIEQSIAKLEEVIKELIQYSRNSRAEMNFVQINIYDFLQEIIRSFKYMPGYPIIQFDVKVPKDAVAMTDTQRLQMVLHNILSNAIKYRDAAKSKNWVQIIYNKNEANWQLEVIDNGIGILKEHQKNIFQMFYRATEQSDGSGLGLFIVKEAVEKLQGKISLKSEEGRGSEFLLTFSPIDGKKPKKGKSK